ncbi:MAG: hypothetical protein WBF17_26730, partial [Phycisphaerae bacterium]
MAACKPIVAALCLAAAALADGGKAVESVGQYGVVWRLGARARAGKYVNGDWWVVGPVTVEGVRPAPAAGRSGSVVNPPAGKRQGYDDRISGYDAALAATFPLKLRPGESLVSTHSVEKIGDRTAETVKGQYARGPLRTAVVLTCVREPPADDEFRPAYCGKARPVFRASRLRRDLLPKLQPPGALPDRKLHERYLQRIWLDHLFEWPGRMMHPLENMPDYGREITHIVSRVGLMLLLDDPRKEHETLLIRFVQLGIDLYGITQSDGDLWRANGGHHSGRKWPIVFAGIMLDCDGMKNVRASFAEDQQTYYGKGWRGQKALWQNNLDALRRHEHLPPEKWSGPPFEGANNGHKSEGYRKLNGPTWVGQALAARLMGARKAWGHDAFFDYVDRWVKEEVTGRDAKTAAGAAGGPFVHAMWRAYRDKADEIAAR